MPQTILFTEQEVPVGALVALYLEGKLEPEQDANGQLLVFISMMGGILHRKKLYPVGSITLTLNNQLDGTGAPVVIRAASIEGFRDDVRFAPIEAFGLQEAPVNRAYLVCHDGKPMTNPDKGSEWLWVRKYPNGKILCSSWAASPWTNKEFPIPPDAALVAIGELDERDLLLAPWR